MELRENTRSVLPDSEYDSDESLGEKVRRRIETHGRQSRPESQQKGTKREHASAGSTYNSPAIVPNLTRSQKSKHTVQIKPRTTKSQLDDVSAIYGASSSNDYTRKIFSAQRNHRPTTTGKPLEGSNEQMIGIPSRQRTTAGSNSKSSVDRLYIQQLQQQKRKQELKQKYEHRSVQVNERQRRSQEQGHQQSTKQGQLQHRKELEGEQMRLQQQNQRQLLHLYEDHDSLHGSEIDTSNCIKVQYQPEPLQNSSGQHIVEDEQERPRAVYKSDRGEESSERTLERPQSRKLYLGNGEVSTNPRSNAPKSAGAIKTEGNPYTLKRLNSFGGFLGNAQTSSSAEFEKRPPSRQSSAFPVHLAREENRSKQKDVPSARTAPSTPRGYNAENSITRGSQVKSNNISIMGFDNHPSGSLLLRNVDIEGFSLDRPPSRQKDNAQNLWDGGNSREGSSSNSNLHCRYAQTAIENSRMNQNPKSDGFLDLEDVDNVPFKIMVKKPVCSLSLM